MQFSIEINGTKAIAKRGETILNVLLRNGIRVPTLCCMAGFTPTGSCRMCVVEVAGIEGLVPACSHPVEEWMQIKTHSPEVLKARRTLVELVLANHPDDCLYCDRTGTCELQKIASELNIRERKYHPRKPSVLVDRNCSAIERDPAKCILCERCIRVCNETIGVNAIEIIGRGSNSSIGTSYNNGLNMQSCVKCGQCINVCPTDALKEKSNYQQIIKAFHEQKVYPVIRITPSVSLAVAEEFSMKPGKDFTERLILALKKAGFAEVHDSSVGADIYSLKVAEILTEKAKNRDKTTIFTTNCPSWVHYLRNFKPELETGLVTIPSPQYISGRIIHDNYFRRNGEDLLSVTATTCTATKAESLYYENNPGEKSTDTVITARELIKLIRHFGIDLTSVEAGNDNGFENRGSSGKLFETAGGTTESIIRSFYFQMTGQELNPVKISELRGFRGRKEYKLKIGKFSYTFVAVNGLNNVKPLLEEIASGKSDIMMVEVMACPGGCINGGGHRFGTDEKTMKNRAKLIQDADEEEMIKAAHKNPSLLNFANFLMTQKTTE